MSDATSTPAAASVNRALRTTVVGGGHDVLLPFDVPPGACRVSVTLATTPRAEIELGLFDSRGPGYRSPGFRGIYGPERNSCYVGSHDASPGFRAGALPAGEWTVLLVVGAAPYPTEVTVHVALDMGPARTWSPPPVPGTVRDEPGWYRGDLHGHTTASSDAWAAGTALTVGDWAAACRRLGLHFAAMTDHNVVGQNHELAEAAGDDVLLLAGEEVTNWTHGHATASGLPADGWLDWRHRPSWLPLGRHERRIVALVDASRELGAYLAAAHPHRDPFGWQFFAEAETDPAAMPDGLEVWNGAFDPADRAAVAYWDDLLQRGWRVAASGGSDLHGHETDGRTAGMPTTVVYADALSRDAVVAALRCGRSFITRHPGGVEVYLDAIGDDGRATSVGGTLYLRPDEAMTVRALVRHAAGTVVGLYGGGRLLHHQPITTDPAVVETRVPASAGYVRAEVQRPPDAGVRAPAVQEALTNPIFVQTGPAPDVAPFHAPPPPADRPRATP